MQRFESIARFISHDGGASCRRGPRTRTRHATTPTNYRLKSELDTITRGGASFERWQHKPTATGTARVWFYVDGPTVFLEQVHTHHPNETK